MRLRSSDTFKTQKNQFDTFQHRKGILMNFTSYVIMQVLLYKIELQDQKKEKSSYQLAPRLSLKQLSLQQSHSSWNVKSHQHRSQYSDPEHDRLHHSFYERDQPHRRGEYSDEHDQPYRRGPYSDERNQPHRHGPYPHERDQQHRGGPYSYERDQYLDQPLHYLDPVHDERDYRFRRAQLYGMNSQTEHVSQGFYGRVSSAPHYSDGTPQFRKKTKAIVST